MWCSRRAKPRLPPTPHPQHLRSASVGLSGESEERPVRLQRCSPTSHKIGDPSDSEITETPGHNRNSRVGVLVASTASPSTYRSTEAAPPVAPVAPAPRVKLEGSATASASSATASRLPSVSRSSAASALTLADLERVLELRAVVAGEQQADALAARDRADLLEHELRETMKRVSQLEEYEKTASALVRSLKEQVVQLENRNISLQELHQSTNLERDSWSTERIRLDATIRDNERVIASMTADYHRDAGNRQLVLGRRYDLTAQVRKLSDEVAMGNTSAHQLLKRQLADKDNEIRRLLCTIRMSPVVSEFQCRSPFLAVAAMLGELVSRSVVADPECGRSPTSFSVSRSFRSQAHSPDFDADSSGSAMTSGHASSRSSTSSRTRKKARATPTPSPISSQKSSSKRSTNKTAAKARAAVVHSPSEDSDDEDGPAPLRRPRRTAAANCSAIQRLLHAGDSDSDSEVLGEAAAISSSSDCDRQAIADLASANASVSSSALAEGLKGADSSGVERSSTSRQTEPASTLASLSGATKSVVIRALPPGKHPAWGPSDSDSDGGDSTGGGSAATPPNLSNRLVESSDPSGDESTLAGSSKPKSQASSTTGSGSPPLASPTVAVRPPQVATSAPVSATAKAPVSSKTPPLARSTVRSATSTSKSSSASKAKAVVPARSAKDASKPKPASKAKSPAAIRSAKDGSKPKSASKPSASASGSCSGKR
ncbi:unnamed protein product [Phytophthora fragariaefolia]|uniref:Unnamed protein product n=1 Tax=Phytophthora fragariaefolia TaxID=1490495 RepID=A0A9W6TZB5_9STRA|nr:unnamed protein product [Phytophthora fragariaefolia]